MQFKTVLSSWAIVHSSAATCGLCSGLSDCRTENVLGPVHVLGCSHRRPELQGLTLVTGVWCDRSRSCLGLSPLNTSLLLGDSTAPVCLAWASSSHPTHSGLSEKLTGCKGLILFLEVSYLLLSGRTSDNSHTQLQGKLEITVFILVAVSSARIPGREGTEEQAKAGV